MRTRFAAVSALLCAGCLHSWDQATVQDDADDVASNDISANDASDTTSDVPVVDAVDSTDVPSMDAIDASDTAPPPDAPTVTINQLASISAMGHPTPTTFVNVATANIVALAPRLALLEGTGNCHMLSFVGYESSGDAGGPVFGGIEIEQTVPLGDAGNCPFAASLIPSSLTIGQSITTLSGQFINACQDADAGCAPNTSARLSLNAPGGTIATGAMQAEPNPVIEAMVMPIAGTRGSMGATTTDLNYQNVVVQVPNAYLEGGLTGSSNSYFITDSMTGTSHIRVNVAGFGGGTCARMFLDSVRMMAMSSGHPMSIGSVTGVLMYYVTTTDGAWQVQVRRLADMPGLPTLCTPSGTP
jgi:hypothetical protein